MKTGPGQRTAVVVGGASGIGAASAAILARDGFRVVIADVKDGSETVAAIRSTGGSADEHFLDLSEPGSFAAFVKDIDDPPISAVVITAALQGPIVPLAEYALSDWETVVGVNLTGTFFFAQTVANVMATRGGGRLVFFMSAAGRTPVKTTIIPYIATKAAIPPMVYSFAYAYRGLGVLVAAVDPGRVLTGINSFLYPNPKDAVTPDMPLGRVLEAEEVAEVVGFLCSERANGVTGAVWSVSSRP